MMEAIIGERERNEFSRMAHSLIRLIEQVLLATALCGVGGGEGWVYARYGEPKRWWARADSLGMIMDRRMMRYDVL